MRAPAFWSDHEPGLAARLLQPAGFLYSLIAEVRMTTVKPARPLVPVVCVGNPTLGGAGKTPVAIAIARRLRQKRLRPGFLSRGYGADITTPVIVERKGSASAYGDEPLLLAKAGLTVCSPNRPWGAETLVEAGAGVIVMDDGFQNPTLAKDLSLLVVDAGAGLGNGLVFPAGPLRMRLAPQLARADAIVLLGKGPAGKEITRIAERRGMPLLHAQLAADAARVERLRGSKLVAYAGIGRPEKFFATLRAEGLDVVETVDFPDHHPYSGEDAERLLDTAKRHGAELVTTEKDAVRLPGDGGEALARLARKSRTLPVEAVFDRVSSYKLNQLLDTLPKAQRKAAKAVKKKPAAKPDRKPKGKAGTGKPRS